MIKMKELTKKQKLDLILEIEYELKNQFKIYGNNIHNRFEWLSILIKQIGDISNSLNKDLDYSTYLKEIIQSITVLIQMYFTFKEKYKINLFD